jgi:hypothetical protein
VSFDEPLGHARLRTGGKLRVVEASSWGALMETTERLRPGRHLDVHVIAADGRMLVRCRVARAFVVTIQPDAVHYQVAFSFDRALDVRAAGYALPSPLLASETELGTPYPHRPSSRDIEFDEASFGEESPELRSVASRLV